MERLWSVAVALALLLTACGSRSQLEVNITSPAEGLRTNQPSLSVTGTVSEAVSELEYTVDEGEPQPLTFADGAFQFEVELFEGLNLIEVRARGAGRTATASVGVRYEPDLVLTLLSPDDGEMLPSPEFRITGTVNKQVASLSYVLNGGEPKAIDVASGVFSVSETAVPGDNSLTVTAVDGSGSEVQEVRSFSYEPLGISFSGDLRDTDPTFVRPPDGAGDLPDAADRTVHYDAFSFSVVGTGRYRIVSEQGYDGYLLLYREAFDPGAPTENLIAFNDDLSAEYDEESDPPGSSGFTPLLEAATPYVLVTTACGNPDEGCGPDTGAYLNSISPVSASP